jgi:exodeoxyribonuclease VII large subunit
VELGRERLAARARMLPRPENLLQPQAQRLDDLADRLRRGLGERSSRGREHLAGVAARLSPSLLTRSAAEAARQLDRARLSPALIERPLRNGADRLAALTRVMSQLHPKKPLERGYAIIHDAGGKALTSRNAAAGQSVIMVEFADGELSATPTGAAPPAPPSAATVPAEPKPRAKPKATRASPSSAHAPRQDDLFG